MKTLIIAAAFLIVPSCVLAQSNGTIGYVEGSLGLAVPSTVSTKEVSGFSGPDFYSGRFDLGYKNDVTLGVELGVAGLDEGGLRMGLSYDYAPFKLDKANFIGTVNGLPANTSLGRNTVSDLGVSLDSQVHIIAANLYYNLPLLGPIRPYIGIGAGGAIIQQLSTEFALSGTAGVRYALSSAMYVGLRYRITRVWDSHDDNGLRYDALMMQSVSAVFGVYTN